MPSSHDSTAAPSQPASEESADRLLQALTAEHYTLQTARAATVQESVGRATVYVGAVTSSVVALGFIGQLSSIGRPFYVFALTLLPALFLLGIATYVRVLENNVQDFLYVSAMNRIREYFLGLDPRADTYVVLLSHPDVRATMMSQGMTPSRSELLFSAASAILIVNSIVAGVAAALALDASGLPMMPSAGLGVLVGVAAVAAFFAHQSHRWSRAVSEISRLIGERAAAHDRAQTDHAR